MNFLQKPFFLLGKEFNAGVAVPKKLYGMETAGNSPILILELTP
jgi:hypothetical protein